MFTLVNDLLNYNYKLNDHILSRLSQVKDLGVNFDTKLSLTEHVRLITSDAIKILGYIIRNSNMIHNEATLKLLY